MDADDSYHYLMAELAPVMLQNPPLSDLGDLNHPAISRALDILGLYSSDDVKMSAGPHPPEGPLYTPRELLILH